jgi:hypothetical protein
VPRRDFSRRVFALEAAGPYPETGVVWGRIQRKRNLTPINRRRRTEGKRIIMSKRVGNTLISELKIPRTDQIEKKKEATEVGRASSLTVNGMMSTNSAAAIDMTIAFSCTSGFLRISKCICILPDSPLSALAVSQGR